MRFCIKRNPWASAMNIHPFRLIVSSKMRSDLWFFRWWFDEWSGWLFEDLHKNIIWHQMHSVRNFRLDLGGNSNTWLFSTPSWGNDPSWLFIFKGLKPPTTLRSLLYPFVLIFWPTILLRFIPIDFMDNVTLKLNMSQQRGYALPFKYQSVVLVGADFCSLLYFRLHLMNLMTNIFLHLYSTRFICVRYLKPQRVCLFFVLSSLHQFIAW